MRYVAQSSSLANPEKVVGNSLSRRAERVLQKLPETPPRPRAGRRRAALLVLKSICSPWSYFPFPSTSTTARMLRRSGPFWFSTVDASHSGRASVFVVGHPDG